MTVRPMPATGRLDSGLSRPPEAAAKTARLVKTPTPAT